MEISKEKLDRYERIEKTAAAVSKQFPGRSGENDDLFEMRKALEPLRTLLVSDEEIDRAWNDAPVVDPRSANPRRIGAPRSRAIGALYLRKAADKLRANKDRDDGRVQMEAIARVLESWAIEEVADDK